jgi:hypothetical protein
MPDTGKQGRTCCAASQILHDAQNAGEYAQESGNDATATASQTKKGPALSRRPLKFILGEDRHIGPIIVRRSKEYCNAQNAAFIKILSRRQWRAFAPCPTGLVRPISFS